MLNSEKNTISANPQLPKSQDYEALRTLGIEHIQKLSSKLWTDFNVHDPGVTIFELLCYALTDLGYRTNFNIKDILTKEGDTSPILSNSFFTAKKILTFHPITILDYRKLILDHFPKIRNVWFKPIESAYVPNIFVAPNHAELTFSDETNTNKALEIGGLYAVKIELQESDSFDFKVTKDDDLEAIKIKKEVHGKLMEHRNLGEDFACIELVKYEYVGICADFELHKTANPITVKKAIYKAIYEYITPPLRFYTIEELLAKGKSIEEIFQGSIAKNGFVDYDELKAFENRDKLYTSDLINILMDIKEIKSVRKLHFSSYELADDKQTLLKDGEKYCLHLTDLKKVFRFRLDIIDDEATVKKENRDKSHINKFNFYFDDLHVPIKTPKSKYAIEGKEEIKLEDIVLPREVPVDFKNNLPKLTGRNRDLAHHYSIQHEFPKTYSLGKEGISDQASVARKAQRLQLKGYLMFFEQILADYLAQLSHVPDLLSWNGNTDDKSYFYQSLSAKEIEEVDKIVDLERIKKADFDSLFSGNNYARKVLGQTPDDNFDRRNRFLNHLIARFNESFVEFSIAQFIEHSSDHKYSHAAIVADKKSFLRSYPKLSGGRSHAFDYSKEVWNTTNMSGFELRVSKKIGLSNTLTSNPDKLLVHSLVHPVFNADGTLKVFTKKNDKGDDENYTKFIDNRSDSFDEVFGFHIIEHHLLRPRWMASPLLDICEDPNNFNEGCFCRDPYSFKITIVMPGWLRISMDMSFRKYIEKTIREELPAHISAKICWIGAEKMFDFEQCYYAFTHSLRVFSQKETCYDISKELDNPTYGASLAKLINCMEGLNNIYPPSFLVECEDIVLDDNNDIKKHPVILGKSTLKNYELKDIWEPKSGKLVGDTAQKQATLEKDYFDSKLMPVMEKSETDEITKPVEETRKPAQKAKLEKRRPSKK